MTQLREWHLEPQPLAEHIPPTDITASRRHFERRRNPEGLLRSTWNQVEYALNQNIDIDPAVREYDFEHAQCLISMVLQHPEAHQDSRLGALVLSSYIPLFKKRGALEEVTPEDCVAVYESLGAIMRYLNPLAPDETPHWRMAETAVLTLSARTRQPDLLLYPTSPREENSTEGQFNHDSYFVSNDGKVPIQQKLIRTDKAYDEWITVLTLQPLVERGLRKTQQSDINGLTDQINYLLSLIIAETSGQAMDKDEVSFLNYLSAAVASHRWKRERNLRTVA